ncbi:MAG: siderophore-interacting protein [Microcella pacifica]|uniref:Siderophore-interacting protein n=1 Tax=Microcella pacifica TaxID=2591847 RepID=A0A9E5JS68_9MICO|nr:siderophore-interacting protein [Microcella pacifica]NHF64176.1 siderophore-interacting protein [Microcella pacifica]
MPYTLTRHPFPPAVRELRLGARTVLAREGVERYVRLRFVASRPGGLAGFIAPGGGDHVRIVVGSAEGGPVVLDDDGHPRGESRTETVVAHDVDDGWIDVDVLVHGEEDAEAGVIGAWAARAPLGSPAVMMGPKGSVVLDGEPGEVVIAGDDSALPAVRRYLGMLGSSITGHLLLETRFDLASLGIEPPAGLRLSILNPDTAHPSAALVSALQALPTPADSAERFVFACGEQSIVAPVRQVLAAWGIDVERAVVKGYWRR